MEILDKSVRDYLEGLSNEDLEKFKEFTLIKFSDIIGYDDIDSQQFSLNSYGMHRRQNKHILSYHL